MGRSPCCDESGLKKGPWTPEEDDKLINYIQKHGHGSWRALPKLAGLNRCGKSCRLRWTNYLRPDIKRGKFSEEEEQTILNLHAILGNKWSAIATHLAGRTDNEIKNFWNTHLKKKLIQMGFDPMTHQPRTDIFSTLPHLIALANLFDNPTPTWDPRLQNELLHISRLNHYLHYILHPSPLTTSVLEPPPPLYDLHHASLPFSHLPDLQPPAPALGNCLSKAEMAIASGCDQYLTQGDNSPDGSSSPWVAPPPPPPLTETSITNTGDACSTSSYGGAQMWSELLDDPFFHEIA